MVCSDAAAESHLVLCMCAFVSMSDDVKCNFVRPTYSRQDLLCIGIQCEGATTRDFMCTNNILDLIATTCNSLWIIQRRLYSVTETWLHSSVPNELAQAA